MGGPPLLGDILVTAVCPIEKVTQWVDLLYLTLESKSTRALVGAVIYKLNKITGLTVELSWEITLWV